MATNYAITFDLDTQCLNEAYPLQTYNNAYGDVKRFLLSNGFAWQQGSVYFGDETVDAVKCVIVVQQLVKKYPWFAACAKDVRMLRVEDNNDLMPAIAAAV